MTPDQELTALIDALHSRWWGPAELKAACDRIRLSPCVSLYEFRHHNAMKPVREAWVAAIFARARPWNSDWKIWVEPPAKRFPDFRLCHSRDERPFVGEIVEARHPRLAEEEVQPQGLRHEDPEEHFRAGLYEAVERVRQKAEKNYSPQPHLVVYCNFYSGKAPVDELRAKLDPSRDRFLSIWLLWDEPVKLIQL